MVRLQLAALLLAATGSLAAFESNIIPGAYIVEIDDTQDSSGLLSSIEDSGNVRMRFDSPLFKGLSVQLNDVENAEETASRMFTSAAAKNMWPITLHSRPDTTIQWTGNETAEFRSTVPANGTAAPYSPHVMAQVDKVRAEGYTGKGIKVAIIDSGIDYTHPALGGCFGEGCMVSGGHDFVGDNYNGRNEPVPDADPQDCDGHGTHVAGIIGAQNNTLGFTGAATGVTFGAYRVFGCFGSVADDILVAAFTRAYEEGADIISLSLGMPVGWPNHPWSALISRFVESGVPVIVAAGNEGVNGAFYASSPSDAKGVASIAALENTRTPEFQQLAKYNADGQDTEFLYKKAWKVPGGGELPLWSPSLDANATHDGCEPFPEDTDLSQYLVLFRVGGCTYGDKSTNAAERGANAIALYNNVEGDLEIPTDLYWNMSTNIFIEGSIGEAWIDLLKAEKEVIVNIPGPDKQVSSLVEPENTQNGGAFTHFSTWGPTWELDVKPNFGAAGGSILSTWPMKKGGYAVISGTSMSTPLVAGIYALLGEVRETLDPKYLQTLLASTANPQLFHDGEAYHPFLAPVAQQGGGAVQAYDAAFTTTLLEPSSLSFNDTDFFNGLLNFTLTNEGSDEAVTYQISYVSSRTVLTIDEALGVPAVFPNEMVDAPAQLIFSESEVTLGKGEVATIDVTAKLPEDVDAARLPLWSGWITVNGTDGTSLSLPYQGLAGSLRNTEVLGPKRSWISVFTVQGYLPLPDNSTFNLPPHGTEDLSQHGENVPLLISNFDLGTRLVHAELESLSTGNGTTAGEVVGEHGNFPLTWQPRGRHITDWGGRLAEGGYAPPGYYRFRVKALRLRGDENNEEDWDVSLTQPFSITYQPGNGTQTR